MEPASSNPAPKESSLHSTSGDLQEESAIVQAIERSQDAVVSVIVTKDLPIIERYYQNGVSPFDNFFGNDPFFNPFQFRAPQYRQNGTEEQEVGGGTAFFITQDGLLLTNKHVVNDEDATYTVLLNNEQKLEATVVARDPSNDIALLKVDGDNFTSLDLSLESPLLGQTTIAIGNALAEFRNTVSTGVISGLKRSIDARGRLGSPIQHLDSIIQTDAAINQGNSGGPLLNLKGQVIGMNTAVAADAQNIGFAIPSADLQRAIESYQINGKIVKTFLGVRYIPVTKELKEKNNLQYDYGVLVARGEDATDLAVIPGSPADKAGLLENDIILEIDDQKIEGSFFLSKEIQRRSAGESIELLISRKGSEQVLNVTLQQQE
jgi:S1-C subfamily serine protease